MTYQSEWVKILNPKASLLKFKLPWNDLKTKYLKGKILFQPWGPISSSESRLEVSDKDNLEEIYYDNRQYEEQLFFYNKFIRSTYYFEKPFDIDENDKIDMTKLLPNHKNKDKPMYDHCYDCSCELWILKQYSMKFKMFKFFEILKMVKNIKRHFIFVNFKLE